MAVAFGKSLSGDDAERGRTVTPLPVHPWPEADLETVLSCPVCGGERRTLGYEGLVDAVSGVAPGRWTLYVCADCGSGYIDPRPTATSLKRAYAGYFTHAPEDPALVRPRGALSRLLLAAVNGYQARRHGVRRSPASPLGSWLVELVPPLRSAASAQCRHLPPQPAGGGRLLDVGCGNGGFLLMAQQAGWQVSGVDFDPDAVGFARSRGLQVREGGIEAFDEQAEEFDVISMCHVIEHVPEPLALLSRAHRLLKRGGLLWLETPNIESLGAGRFGRDWRGLEPPRHLVLFNRRALRQLFHKLGFVEVEQRWRGLSVFDVYAASEAIAATGSVEEASYAGRPPLHAVWAELREMLQPARREYITLTARKR